MTYLRRGRRSTSSNESSEVIIASGEPHTRPSRQSTIVDRSRREEGHRLCVRFSKADQQGGQNSSMASSASKAEMASMEVKDENAIEVLAVSEVRIDEEENTMGNEITNEHESRHRRVSLGNVRLRRSNSPVCRRRESRLTRISLAIVWLFLFCHIWKLIPTAYEVFYGGDKYPGWMYFIKHLSHALIVLNSSLNFLIYVIF